VEAQVTKAPTTLEQRLAAALAAERVGVEDARALLSEVEAAIAEAEQAAQQHSDAAEQSKSFRPLLLSALLRTNFQVLAAPPCSTIRICGEG
jgi:predicted RNA-binding Zn ribbon-like protein